jgi:hypothetical protein
MVPIRWADCECVAKRRPLDIHNRNNVDSFTVFIRWRLVCFTRRGWNVYLCMEPRLQQIG